ncbi:MAG: exodeoxyribonuclease VII large subunit [Pseudomonadota bacterium]
MTDTSTPILSISDLNRLARLSLETQLTSCWVCGEVSNMVRASSGHWYFTLKDKHASARCVMFKQRNQFVEWRVTDGEQVELRAQPSLYEARGEFQLIVDAVRKAGLGALFEAFMRLKEKLQREGLFEPSRKRPLPRNPRRIGIITSPRGAAIHDALATLSRRWPLAHVTLYPCLVQGDSAVDSIRSALRLAAEDPLNQILLIIRGGGSLEDLWAYNDEKLARDIAHCPVPVITGIGHETDFTIADFTADARAPTPTAAASLATADIADIANQISSLSDKLNQESKRLLDAGWQKLDILQKQIHHPREKLAEQLRQLGILEQRTHRALQHQIERNQHRWANLDIRLKPGSVPIYPLHKEIHGLVARLHMAMQRGREQSRWRYQKAVAQLDSLNPAQVLQRGFSIVRTSDGHVVSSTAHLKQQQKLNIELASGGLLAEITEIIGPNSD